MVFLAAIVWLGWLCVWVTATSSVPISLDFHYVPSSMAVKPRLRSQCTRVRSPSHCWVYYAFYHLLVTSFPILVSSLFVIFPRCFAFACVSLGTAKNRTEHMHMLVLTGLSGLCGQECTFCLTPKEGS